MSNKELKELNERTKANRERNQKLEQEKRLEELRRLEEIETREKISKVMFWSIIVIVLVLLVHLVANSNKDFIENCVAGGNSYDFCRLATDGK